MDVRIVVDGSDADFESLWDWLRHEQQLRGRLVVTRTLAPDGATGAALELVVALGTSSGGVVAVLARSVSTWLVERERQRRSDVTIKVIGPDGRKVTLSGRVASADTELLMRSALA